MTDAAGGRPQDAPDPEVDTRIGVVLANRFRIEARLGEGAMGSVYRARHVKVGRAFAVKFLRENLLEELKVVERFEREAELAGRLRHPNLVGVVDVGETSDGMRYMVMELAEGENLATLLEAAPLTPERIVHLTKQLLEGLYHAHEAGLIHRDFKPENVIVARDDHGREVPRIIDFGIAILRDGGASANTTTRLTTNGLVLGTPHYMAPEQAVGDSLDHRVDLFALGVVIYEMLSGKLPFDGTGAEVVRANVFLDPPPISQRVPHLDVDPLLEAFTRRLMAKRRDLRPATAKAARELLDLVERDRAAAADALGVSLGASPRAPQVTGGLAFHELSDPRRVGTLADAPGAVSTTAARPSDLETPSLAHRRAPRRSRGGWVIAGISLAVTTATIIGIGVHERAPDPRGQEIVLQHSAPDSPSPQPLGELPVTPSATSATVSPIPVEPGEPTAAAGTHDATSVVVRPTNRRRKPVVKHHEKVANAEGVDTRPVVTKPHVPTPVEAPPPVEVSAQALAAQYAAVGSTLKQLGDEATDLWPSYRRILLNEAMQTPERRAEAAKLLSKLQKLAAARK